MFKARDLIFPITLAIVTLAMLMFIAANNNAFAAQDVKPHWYVGLQGGVNFVSDSDLDAKGGIAPTDGTITFDTGVGLAANVGYRSFSEAGAADFFRFELELVQRTGNMSEFIDATGTNKVSDDLKMLALMANMYFDFNPGGNLNPYVGGGLGAAHYSMDSNQLQINDEDTRFAYQGMAGFLYQPSSWRFTEFMAGYRYFSSLNPELVSANLGTKNEIPFKSHSLEMGFHIYF